MASSLISGAVSLILILLAGYVIATGILTIAETTIYTQSEMSLIHDSIQQTDLSMANPSPVYSGGTLTFYISNNGTTSFKKTDVGFDFFITNDATKATSRYSLTDLSTFDITEDIINKGFWDPSEIVQAEISLAYTPNFVKIVTPNGVSASGAVT
ncbi:hypothetical protein ACKUB1_10595 [Methanospirillum stamsii]|uniref:Flagellar protein FlaF n=1 Tax=Methanospirillum stamsii TaxID=1277351 RepID=A0A2V2NKC4_9EURY|nr:hypothetical protein [Methanospirillum stamsii]PWR75793.1 hypothetical protein DLD82_02865 [Methanospirillum stamsii]